MGAVDAESPMTSELVKRALMQRRRERSSIERPWLPRAQELARQAARRHPVAQVGDYFGTLRVVAIAPRDYTSNERVEVECPNGHRRLAYVFNLRSKPGCRQCPRGSR